MGRHLPVNKRVFSQRQCVGGMPGRNLPLGCCQVDPLSCGVSVGKRTVLCMALLLSVNLHVQIFPFFLIRFLYLSACIR